MYRWLNWQQYGSDVVVIYRVVSPSTWRIRVDATCAYTWRAPFAHLDLMHSLTASPCPSISEYGSKVTDRITCRSIGNGPPRPPLLMNAINCLSLGAYPRQDVAAQMSLRNCFRSSATLLAAVIVPNVSVMSFSHLCLGFPRLLFPATIPCIIVFSKPLCRVTWPKYLSFCRLTKLYIQFVGR